jgi:hypothetical protein
MKKLVKGILGTVIALVLVVVVALVALVFFFPNEKVRQIAQEQLSKQFNREVVIQKLNFHLLKGIVIEGVKISDRSTFDDGTFIDCKAFYVKYNILDMIKAVIVARNPEALKKQTLRISLVLDSPSIFVKRYVEGKKTVFNFSDLIPEKKEAPAAEAKPAPEPASKPAPTEPVKKAPPASVIPKVSASSIPINIEVVELGLKNAKVEVIDTATPKFKEIYSLHDVRLLITGINIRENNPMKINLGFGISVTEFKEGKQSDKDVNIDFDMTGRFTLFDSNGLLNPEGTLQLTLANGKLTGVQFYKELVGQGRDLARQASDVQKEFVKKYEDVKKAIAQVQKTKQASQYLGSYGGDVQKVQALADKLDKVDMSFINKAMDLGFLQDTLSFDRVSALLFVKDQRVYSSNFAMKGPDISAVGKGWVGFNTTLEWDVTLLGAKKYNNNVLTAALANEAGEIAIPVRIIGTVSKPVFKFNVDLKKIVADEIRKRLGPEAGDLIAGKTSFGNLAGQGTDALKQAAQQQVDAVKQEAAQQATAAKKEATKTATTAAKKAAGSAIKKSGVKVPKF